MRDLFLCLRFSVSENQLSSECAFSLENFKIYFHFRTEEGKKRNRKIYTRPLAFIYTHSGCLYYILHNIPTKEFIARSYAFEK